MNAHAIATAAREMDIGIGGLWVRLRTDSPDFVAAMAGRFRGFLGHVAQPDHVFDIELTPFPDGDDEAVDAHADEVQVTRAGHLWQVRRGDFFAQWDPRLRHGHARMVPSVAEASWQEPPPPASVMLQLAPAPSLTATEPVGVPAPEVTVTATT